MQLSLNLYNHNIRKTWHGQTPDLRRVCRPNHEINNRLRGTMLQTRIISKIVCSICDKILFVDLCLGDFCLGDIISKMENFKNFVIKQIRFCDFKKSS